MYTKIKKGIVTEIFGGEEFQEATLDSFEIWHELMKKYNVFYLHKPYFNEKKDKLAMK